MIERLHPDADSLNAFIEGVLPEHERLQCLAHLAECDRCREVVFLTQEPLAAPKPVPIRRRWFAPIPVFSAAAAACLVVAAAWIYLHRTPAPPAHEIATQPVRVSPPAVQQQVQAPPSVTSSAKRESNRVARHEVWPGNMMTRPFKKEEPTLLPPPSLPNQQPSPPLSVASEIAQPAPPTRPQDGLAGITGTVTDPAGAVISGAAIALHELSTSSITKAQTDTSGKFKVSGLPPGRYQLQITSPGFQQTAMQIDLPPREVAIVTPTLSVGSVSETVEVTAATPTLQTESASLAFEPHALPSKLPVATSLANGKIMLSVDSAGTLFLSKNKGKSWKAVKPVWTGKVVELAEPDPPSIAKFQLTTDSGTEWLSRDGSHWYPASKP